MDNIYKQYKASGESNLYHRFEDGVTYVFRISSEPVVYESTFTKGDESNTSIKYGWIVWNVEQKVAQVLQLPLTAYRTIASIASDDEYGDPKNYNIKITRTGTGLETKYDIVPSPRQVDIVDFAPEAPEQLKKLNLIELVEAGKNVSNVFWLSDAIGKPTNSTPLRQHEVLDQAKDVVIDDDDVDLSEGKPIDLSEIPF